ncbi:MAG: guanitoxin biosynthesis heme-dependent pre-guanitoxin N-hydroxylase GntA [Ginsengibacter sp.]
MKAVYETKKIKQAYLSFINNKDFACIAAKAALAKNQIKCFVSGNMACPNDDLRILEFLYSFVDEYKNSNGLYHSATIIFNAPHFETESMFDKIMWERLQSLSDLDSRKYKYDARVDNDPYSPNFSFSLREEAFFIIALHPASSRPLRRFAYPALVFNPHKQFEELRETGKYDKMKEAVRKRDMAYSGSVNPMLSDFGEASEIYQYSGRKYDDTWQCPLKINHYENENNIAT